MSKAWINYLVVALLHRLRYTALGYINKPVAVSAYRRLRCKDDGLCVNLHHHLNICVFTCYMSDVVFEISKTRTVSLCFCLSSCSALKSDTRPFILLSRIVSSRAASRGVQQIPRALPLARTTRRTMPAAEVIPRLN